MKIDVFAHFLPAKFYQQMLKIEPNIPTMFPFIKIKTLVDIDARIKQWPRPDVKQVISLANINPEDFCQPQEASQLCQVANDEFAHLVDRYPDYFSAGVGALPMNNIPAAVEILEKIAQSSQLVGAQIFTRHLGKSIAEEEFRPVFAKAAELGVPLWLHPVFDNRKPDNNLVFSWEYELSQAMLQLVTGGIFSDYPNLKILVHHAGAMVPFFAGRIDHILPADQAKAFKKFYVDTAILGNPAALRLAIDYFGIDHVLFGTDAPFAVMPAGATDEIITAIDDLHLSSVDQQKIYSSNYQKFIQNKR